MQNMGLLMEYEDILLKKRKDFSAKDLSSQHILCTGSNKRSADMS